MRTKQTQDWTTIFKSPSILEAPRSVDELIYSRTWSHARMLSDWVPSWEASAARFVVSASPTKMRAKAWEEITFSMSSQGVETLPCCRSALYRWAAEKLQEGSSDLVYNQPKPLSEYPRRTRNLWRSRRGQTLSLRSWQHRPITTLESSCCLLVQLKALLRYQKGEVPLDPDTRTNYSSTHPCLLSCDASADKAGVLSRPGRNAELGLSIWRIVFGTSMISCVLHCSASGVEWEAVYASPWTKSRIAFGRRWHPWWYWWLLQVRLFWAYWQQWI